MPSPIGRRTDACYADDEPELSCEGDPATHDDDTTATPARPSAAAPTHTDAAAPDCDRIPDYVTLSAGGRAFLAIGDAYTIDRCGKSLRQCLRGVRNARTKRVEYRRVPARHRAPVRAAHGRKAREPLTGTSRTEIL